MKVAFVRHFDETNDSPDRLATEAGKTADILKAAGFRGTNTGLYCSPKPRAIASAERLVSLCNLQRGSGFYGNPQLVPSKRPSPVPGDGLSHFLN